jgi:hypothetical protein
MQRSVWDDQPFNPRRLMQPNTFPQAKAKADEHQRELVEARQMKSAMSRLGQSMQYVWNDLTTGIGKLEQALGVDD